MMVYSVKGAVNRGFDYFNLYFVKTLDEGTEPEDKKKVKLGGDGSDGRKKLKRNKDTKDQSKFIYSLNTFISYTFITFYFFL